MLKKNDILNFRQIYAVRYEYVLKTVADIMSLHWFTMSSWLSA